MNFNDLLKQYQVSPDQPRKPAPQPPQPVKPVPQPEPVRPVTPVQPVKPAAPVQGGQPSRPASSGKPRSESPAPPQPVHPAQPVKPAPQRPSSGAQQLLDELAQDIHGSKHQHQPVQPLRPGKDNRPAARIQHSDVPPARQNLPPYWYLDAIFLGVTLLAALMILINWHSLMDAAAQVIMNIADVAIVALIVLAAALIVILALRRRYRLWRVRRWWRW